MPDQRPPGSDDRRRPATDPRLGALRGGVVSRAAARSPGKVSAPGGVGLGAALRVLPLSFVVGSDGSVQLVPPKVFRTVEEVRQAVADLLTSGRG